MQHSYRTVRRCEPASHCRGRLYPEPRWRKDGQRTALPCGHCRVETFRIVDGGETRWMLGCPRCGHYVYFISLSLRCIGFACEDPSNLLEEYRVLMEGGE
jgi:hypothetical protein